MTRISVINCVTLLLAVFLYYAAESESLSVGDGKDRKEASPMWFGPRIGRKKRNNPIEIKTFGKNGKENQEIYEVVPGHPLLVVAVEPESAPAFNPRMGRESTAELLSKWNEDMIRDALYERSAADMTPRMGRSEISSFISPRLGRENDMSLQ